MWNMESEKDKTVCLGEIETRESAFLIWLYFHLLELEVRTQELISISNAAGTFIDQRSQV